MREECGSRREEVEGAVLIPHVLKHLLANWAVVRWASDFGVPLVGQWHNLIRVQVLEEKINVLGRRNSSS